VTALVYGGWATAGSEGRAYDPRSARGRSNGLEFTRATALARCASAETDNADGHAFTERGREDRQFRFIIAPEDGDRLSDLRAATRDLMRQMEERVTLELGPEPDLELKTKLQAKVSADKRSGFGLVSAELPPSDCAVRQSAGARRRL
jgi:hypothetical protein